MRTKIPVQLATSAFLILGGAAVAWAQSTTFTDFGCVIDLGVFPDVPEDFAGLAPVTTDTEKQCPGTPESPTVILRCFATYEGWDPAVTINTTNFACFISGSQCGFAGSGEATSQHLQIVPRTENGVVFGDAELRCSANRGAFD